MKKGMLFTLDSLFAMIIALGLITFTIFALKSINANAWSDTNINELSMDYLTILEQDSTLKNAVLDSSTRELKDFLNMFTRDKICAKLKIFDENDNLLLLEVKTGCFSSENIQITKRTFVVNNDMYYAVIEGWPNE